MKKFIYICVFSFILISIFGSISGITFGEGTQEESYYYYSESKKISLPLSTEGIVVKFKKGTTLIQMRLDVESEPEMAPFSKRQELLSPEFVILKTQEGVTSEVINKLIDRFARKPQVEFVSPIFNYQGTKMALSDEIIVKFKSTATDTEISELNQKYGATIVKSGVLSEKGYILKLPQRKSAKDVLNIANTYYKNPIVEYAHPNFLRLLKPVATPDDPYFDEQWNLNNTGQNGWTVDADIDAPEAWDINTGSSTVTIAIIDEGVDLNHEDLVDNLVTGYDATGGGSGGGANSWDGHGTSCAGIASAVTNNAIGVAGVNWNVKIMPVRIAYTPYEGYPYWLTYDSWIADGIQWAVDNGADVLSNSWGGGSPSDVINDAIRYAKTNGRGGKGSVVVFASGNENSSVIYPAVRPEVIAVGATSPCDERKNPSSCDGEWWWGSNYGHELDVTAPGVKIYTTDIMGTGGYISGNYISDFNGTSSATPHVAGLAGLILSENPSLTAPQVEIIIKDTTDDIEDPGWDIYTGHGRINAYNALLSLGEPIHHVLTPPQDVTVAPGDILGPFLIEVTNISSSDVQFYTQPYLIKPDGTIIWCNQLLINMPANETRMRRRILFIPSWFQEGEFTWGVRLTDIEGNQIDDDSFNFTVTRSASSHSSNLSQNLNRTDEWKYITLP